MISRIVSLTDGSSALMCALLLALLSSILLVSYVAGMYTKFRSIDGGWWGGKSGGVVVTSVMMM